MNDASPDLLLEASFPALSSGWTLSNPHAADGAHIKFCERLVSADMNLFPADMN
jgi:hypothetical protein